MNTMKRVLMMSALLAASSSCFAEMKLELVNEAAEAQVVTFGKALANGATTESVNANSTETVVVGAEWKGNDVAVTWANGDVDTVHFNNDGTLRSTSDDDTKDAEAQRDVLTN